MQRKVRGTGKLQAAGGGARNKSDDRGSISGDLQNIYIYIIYLHSLAIYIRNERKNFDASMSIHAYFSQPINVKK